MMPIAPTDPRLLIDDTETDLNSIWIHAQDDPYPGGHRYSLWLPASIAESWLLQIGLEKGQRYDGMEHVSRDALYWLHSALAQWHMQKGDQGGKPCLFVLNTLAQVAPAGQGVEIRGVCSPFVR